ncbi:MAG TPA: GlsB/YeaQ/YmgE family stress response membrane protein [Thermoanaerobaculia bacterium]|nr:GlsB/YeaQ/YmgE family stress response membrane protein [Thermoanaerobaculia bacterium]
MGILTWILLGLIVGFLAKLIMPGRDPGGVIITILLGIAGALLGGFIGTALGFGTVDGINIGSVALATLGAFLLLALYRLSLRRTA